MNANSKNPTKRLTKTPHIKNVTSSSKNEASSSATTPPPTIPNVTPDAAPLLIEVIKLQKKYLSLEQQHWHQHQQQQQQQQQLQLKIPREQEKYTPDYNGLHNTNKTRSSSRNRRRREPETTHGNHDNVKESIFARIDASCTNQLTSEEIALQQQKQHIDQVLQSLMACIHKNRRDIRHDIIDDSLVEEYNDKLGGCAIGCLEFLLELIQDDKAKIILRHAALCICRYLLWQRCDCRIVFTTNTTNTTTTSAAANSGGRIKSYIDAIGNAHGHWKVFRAKIGTEQSVFVYQREGLKLLQDLSLKFRFAQPTLVIAARYLEEQKGISMVSTTGTTTTTTSMNSILFNNRTNAGMAELRRIRDIALTLTDREVAKIRKLLVRVDRCFEILVPRFGHDFALKSFPVVGTLNQDTAAKKIQVQVESQGVDPQSEMIDCNHNYDDDDDDDDNVDWEDGMDHTNDNENHATTETTFDHTSSEDHLVRVERTLAIMRQSGALSSDGTMNVSLGALNTTAHGDQSVEIARQVLSKNMSKLLKRQEKIILWMDAIVSADNMIDARKLRNDEYHQSRTQSSHVGTSSLVLLPESLRRMKPKVLKTLTECRNSIAAAISAASKIEIEDKLKSDEQTRSTEDTDSAEARTEILMSCSWHHGIGVKKELGTVKTLNSVGNLRPAKKPRLSIQIRKH